jgi:hypothetical protein
MIAAIKPKVVNQHRVPISKSALTPIVYPRFVLGRFSYLYKTAGLVNTWITRGQNCHSRPSTKAGHDAAEGAVLPRIVAFSEGLRIPPLVSLKLAGLVGPAIFCSQGYRTFGENWRGIARTAALYRSMNAAV